MFQQLFIAIALNLVSSALARAAAPKPQNAKPQDFDIPRVKEGESLTVIEGTILDKSPLVVNVGHIRKIPVRKKGGKK